MLPNKVIFGMDPGYGVFGIDGRMESLLEAPETTGGTKLSI